MTYGKVSDRWLIDVGAIIFAFWDCVSWKQRIIKLIHRLDSAFRKCEVNYVLWNYVLGPIPTRYKLNWCFGLCCNASHGERIYFFSFNDLGCKDWYISVIISIIYIWIIDDIFENISCTETCAWKDPDSLQGIPYRKNFLWFMTDGKLSWNKL